jgi:hypothetical protein
MNKLSFIIAEAEFGLRMKKNEWRDLGGDE